jgi:hypothetical protein
MYQYRAASASSWVDCIRRGRARGGSLRVATISAANACMAVMNNYATRVLQMPRSTESGWLTADGLVS